jgi:succinoglycan biosynthesis transport protein ExoP
MKLFHILLVLRARSRLVLLALVAIVLASAVVNLLLPKTYRATTTLVVNSKGADPVSGLVTPLPITTGYLATQADIIQSKAVALAVVESQHLAESPTAKEEFLDATNNQGNIRDWLAELLLKKLDVVPGRESSVVTINFTGTNPEFAAMVANAFASEYQKTSIRLKAQPLKQASAYFNEQIKDLRDKLEQAQARLSKYQQDKGLVGVDNRLDVETDRLNELSKQLGTVQGRVAEATSRHSASQGASADNPDVVGNVLVQTLKASLTQAEANLSQLAERAGVNHPQYLAAKAEVDKRRAELATQVDVAYRSLGNGSRIAQQGQASLEAAVAAQKARILRLNHERDELSVLAREVDGAQKVYDAAIARYSQTSLEGGSNQTDVVVLSPALPPMKPVSPRVLVNMLLSVLFGAAFGMALAMLLEMLDQRVHSADDVVGMQIPVLADWSRPRKARSRLSLSRLIPGRRPRPV